jgi:diguanylate cyclase (GGDEF)-like protein/PAS domain S-box-containing protein
MSMPMPEKPASATRSARPHRNDPARDRLLVARKWAYLISSTTYIPLPYADVERELLGVTNRLFDILLAEQFDPEPATELAIRLVGMNCVGESTFQRTMEVLGKSMLSLREPRDVQDLPTKVVTLLGTFAAGYAEGLRRTTLAQQEDLNRTMVTIGRDSRLALRASEARFAAVLEASQDGVAVVAADGRFLRTNAGLGQLLDCPELADLNLFDMLPPVDARSVRAGFDRLAEGTLRDLSQRRVVLTRTGDTLPVTITGRLLRDPDRPTQPDRFALVVRDDSELRLLQNQLTRQSLHDVVTGLPNRQFFTTRLETTLHQAAAETGVTLYHLDLDGFAMVAVGNGRTAGDRLLKIVAERLKAAVAGEQAMVARLDSDEFAVLVENSPTTPNLGTIVDRINARLAEPVHSDGESMTVSTGIGVVHRPRAGLDPTELLRRSDLAMRRAKQRGRGQWELFDDRMDHEDRTTFRLATSMPVAWQTGEVRLEYRPEVALRTGVPVAVEPRLRWDRRGCDPIGHERCVDLAERTGLTLKLGGWLLRSAAARPGDLPIVVALSAAQTVDPDLADQVLAVLAEDGLPAGRLCLGFPTRLLRGDRPEPTEHVRLLAEAGVGVALHGFGGGAQDLALLTDLPVAGVRIESAGASTALLDRAWAELVSIVHDAGGTVAVAGVDTQDDLDHCRRIGADTALGRLFTNP